MENILLDHQGQLSVPQFLYRYISQPIKTIQSIAPSSLQLKSLLWKSAWVVLFLLSLTEITPYSHFTGVVISFVLMTLILNLFASIFIDFFAQLMNLKAQSSLLMPWLIIGQLPYVLLAPVISIILHLSGSSTLMSAAAFVAFFCSSWLKISSIKSLYACTTTQSVVLIFSPILFLLTAIFIFLGLVIYVIGVELISSFPIQ